MTRAEHLTLWKQHVDRSMKAVSRYIESHDISDWEEYKEESKLANKHYGIASAMFTKARRKLGF